MFICALCLFSILTSSPYYFIHLQLDSPFSLLSRSCGIISVLSKGVAIKKNQIINFCQNNKLKTSQCVYPGRYLRRLPSFLIEAIRKRRLCFAHKSPSIIEVFSAVVDRKILRWTKKMSWKVTRASSLFIYNK